MGELAGAEGDPRAAQRGFEQLPDAVVMVRGRELLIVAANAAFRELTGRRDLIGVPLRELWPGDSRARLLDLVEQSRRSGAQITEGEWRASLPRAQERFGEARLALVLVPQPPVDGHAAGVLVQMMDASVLPAPPERSTRQAREFIHDLQGAALPTFLPTLPQVRIAAAYRGAESGKVGGGDWFDAITLADGRVALMVGDIVGGGIRASTGMVRLQAVLEESLTRTMDPLSALRDIERLAARTPEIRASTLCLAVLDPARGELVYATCGHPAPLVLGGEGSARLLPSTGGSPLGVGDAVRVSTARVDLAGTIVLYSDGMVEHGGRTAGQRTQMLARAVRTAVLGGAAGEDPFASAADHACRAAIELLPPESAADATVLAAHRLAQPPAAFHRRCEVEIAALAELQEDLRAWLVRLGASRDETRDLDLALVELVTNVLEHAYPVGERGIVEIGGTVGLDGDLRLTVEDRGRWREPDATDITGGRGLWITGSLVDDLSIEHGADGTTVTLRRLLHRPAQVLPLSRGAGPPDDRSTLELSVEEGIPARVAAIGRIDLVTVREFTDQLDSSCRGGLRPLTVDLTAVELLASAGIRALLSIRERLATHGHGLDLIAATGTPVQTVLDLVGLPWRSEDDRGAGSPIRAHDHEEDPSYAWPDRA